MLKILCSSWVKAIEFEDEQTGNKSCHFEIHREEKKAFHLSEGEKSLIAFCYFVAKLQDVDTKSKKPIIWVDDPVSSLDSNHIFFIYSLINTEICAKDDFEQLFISTHNLNFLNYLKRLPKALNKDYSNYLIVERTGGNESTISEMPRYMKDYVTEFNHLFKQINECARIDNITDDNYTLFYNFGNNTRKFLEIFVSAQKTVANYFSHKYNQVKSVYKNGKKSQYFSIFIVVFSLLFCTFIPI